jgi:septum formation protein
MAKRIILASTSPFRKKLLEDSGFSFTTLAPESDEKTISGLPPRELASRRAEFKALDVARRAPAGSIVIGADQVLGMNGKSYDKAETAEEATARILEFQGKTHELYSAYTLVLVNKSGSIEVLENTVVTIPMTMKALSADEARTYVATGEWQGCVGCYRIEGAGRDLFAAIGADISSIIGLPMAELSASLNKIQSRHHPE